MGRRLAAAVSGVAGLVGGATGTALGAASFIGFSYVWAVAFSTAGLLSAALAYWTFRKVPDPMVRISRATAAFWAVCGFVALVVLFTTDLRIQNYGDSGCIVWLMRHYPTSMYRWYIGLPALRLLHGPFDRLTDWGTFLRAAGICAMVGGSVFVLLRYPKRLSVVFATLTPLAFALSVGYLEYCPFYAALYLWYFAAFAESDRYSPYIAGLAAGLLPTVYMAFAPFSVFLGVAFAVRSRKLWDIVKMGLVAVVSFLIVVRIVDGPDMFLFVEQYREAALHFWGQGTIPRYTNVAPGSGNWFPSAYAFSREHITDVAYMVGAGAGWHFAVPLALGLVSSARLKGHYDKVTYAFFAVLAAWTAYYTLYYIPRMGPCIEIDQFCGTYTLLAFLAGHFVQRGVEAKRLPDWVLPAACAFVVAGSAALVPQLIIFRLPDF